jgi:hypothetical protein
MRDEERNYAYAQYEKGIRNYNFILCMKHEKNNIEARKFYSLNVPVMSCIISERN